MKIAAARRMPRLIWSIFFVLVLLLVSWPARGFATAACPPDTNPCQLSYFKATGADVAAGGWFNTGNTQCDTSPTSNYQDSNFSSATQPADAQDRYGGILTWDTVNQGSGLDTPIGGSSSEFAALSLGEIEEAPGNIEGFYTNGVGENANNGSLPVNSLDFGNSFPTLTNPPAGDYGGLFVPPNGVRITSFCVPDYYTTMMPNNPAPGALPGGVLTSATPSGNYAITSTGTMPIDLDSAGPVTITSPPTGGTHIDIFVSGDIYISHNITYGPYNAGNVPKFALVVQGNVYISPNVTEIDGLYIAQPNPTDPAPNTDDTGDIWTCHNDTTNPVSYLYPAVCNQKLVVEGALIAKAVELIRPYGDATAASATTAEDGFQNAPSSGAAEVVNYPPDMVIGGGFFSVNSTGTVLNSLISLPPIY